MSFREILDNDILDTFLDDYEFAGDHIIAGKKIKACIDTDNLVRLKNSDIIGVSEADIILFAKTKEMPPNLKEGSVLNVDGREMSVVSIRRELGMSEVSLKSYRGY